MLYINKVFCLIVSREQTIFTQLIVVRFHIS